MALPCASRDGPSDHLPPLGSWRVQGLLEGPGSAGHSPRWLTPREGRPEGVRAQSIPHWAGWGDTWLTAGVGPLLAWTKGCGKVSSSQKAPLPHLFNHALPHRLRGDVSLLDRPHASHFLNAMLVSCGERPLLLLLLSVTPIRPWASA